MGVTKGSIRRIVGGKQPPRSLPLREGARCAPFGDAKVRATRDSMALRLLRKKDTARSRELQKDPAPGCGQARGNPA
jgi:hypothetical protein